MSGIRASQRFPGLVVLTYSLVYGGREVSNTFYVYNLDRDWNPDAAATLHSKFADWISTEHLGDPSPAFYVYRPPEGLFVRLVSVGVTRLLELVHFTTSFGMDLLENSSGPLPTNVAPVIHWDIGRAGRGRGGRTYMWGLDRQYLTSDLQRVAPEFAEALVASWGNLTHHVATDWFPRGTVLQVALHRAPLVSLEFPQGQASFITGCRMPSLALGSRPQRELRRESYPGPSFVPDF